MRYKLHKANTTKQVLCSFVTDINTLVATLGHDTTDNKPSNK